MVFDVFICKVGFERKGINMKCNVCEREFDPVKEIRYTAKKVPALFALATFYDCFDCPHCGCQIVIQERIESAVAKPKTNVDDISEVFEDD